MIPARGKRLKRKKRDKIDYTTRKNVVYEYFAIEKNITWHVFFLLDRNVFQSTYIMFGGEYPYECPGGPHECVSISYV